MRALFVFTALIGLSGVASAQSGQNPLLFEAMSKAKPGQWAEYSVVAKGGNGKPMKMRYALVEKTADKAAFEIESDSPYGKMLAHMSYTADGPTGWKLTGARVNAGGAVQDMPADALAAMGGVKKGDSFGKLIGSEEVKTSLGSFPCKHYQKTLNGEGGAPAGAVVDLWMSDKALPMGLVKVADARGDIMLAATGNDAKPQVDMKAPASMPPTGAAPAAPAKK